MYFLKSLVCCICFFIFTSFSFAHSLQQADESFTQGLYQQALKQYDDVFQTTKDVSLKWKAFFKACESLSRLYRWEEVVQRLVDLKLPANKEERARAWLFKTEMLKSFADDYQYVLSEDIVHEKQSDVSRLTTEQIDAMVFESYRELWLLRDTLLKIPTKGDVFFKQESSVDWGAYPTFFDYIVSRWIDFITHKAKRGEGLERLAKEDILKPSTRENIDLSAPLTLLALQLMEVASQAHLKTYREANERWQIERLLFPLRENMFNFEYNKEDYQQITDTLSLWMQNFKTDNARAHAGYEAAQILNQHKQYRLAVDLCENIEKQYSHTDFALLCRNLRKSIQKPFLMFRFKQDQISGQKILQVEVKNIKTVYVRFYPIELPSFDIGENLNTKYDFCFDCQTGWEDIAKKIFIDSTYIKNLVGNQNFSSQLEIPIEDEPTYAQITKDWDLSNLQSGLYLVLLSDQKSFDEKKALLSQGIFNQTDLFILGTAGFTLKASQAQEKYFEDLYKQTIQDEAFRVYIFDAKTGQVAQNIDAIQSFPLLNGTRTQPIQLNQEGMALFDVDINIGKSYRGHYSFDVLLKNNKEVSFLYNYLQLYPTSDSIFNILIQTDRPIYRPGQTVHAKMIVTQKTQNGFMPPLRGQEVLVKVRDVNREVIFEEKALLNDFGTAAVSFDLPEGRLLGNYSIHVEYGIAEIFYKQHSSAAFSVEEYQRPEFEVLLSSAGQRWKYDEPVEIKGDVKYYFGGAVSQANVKYRIKKQRYIPICFYYYMMGERPHTIEVARGEAITDEQGEFTIAFTPSASPNQSFHGLVPDIDDFIVEVESQDAGGRTITAQKSYRVGKQSFYFALLPKKNFFLEGEAVIFDILKQSINDIGLAEESFYELYTLDASDLAEHKEEKGPLDRRWAKVKNARMLQSGLLEHDEQGKTHLTLGALSQGVYRLRVKDTDEQGQEVSHEKIFLVVNHLKEKIPFDMNDITLFDQDEYVVGDTAKVLFGSSFASSRYIIEIFKGEYFIKNDVYDFYQGIQMIEIPITEQLQGGFTFKWFSVKNWNLFFGASGAFVGWPEKKLTVQLPLLSKVLRPGQEIRWDVHVYNAQGKKEPVEILALMFDRSLEYYRKHDISWIDALYRNPIIPSSSFEQNLNHFFNHQSVSSSFLESTYHLYDPDREEIWRQWQFENTRNLSIFSLPQLYLHLGLRVLQYEPYFMDVAMPLGTAHSTAKMVASESAMAGEMSRNRAESNGEATSASGAIASGDFIRSHFSETAFFFPHLLSLESEGATIQFQAPEQLTSWKVKLFALTKDRKEGSLLEELVTKKDLMARIDIPRFFREKDIGTVTAMVHNESDHLMKGKLSLDIMDQEQSVADVFKIEEREKEFVVEPHQMQSFDWKVFIPQGVKNYQIRVMAQTKDNSDAEERTLMILPSRQHLIASNLVTLFGNDMQTLSISLKEDETRENESMTLEIDSQIASSLLNTIPFLVEYPYNCIEQLVNKYVPLAIMHQMYQDYPALQKIVQGLASRETALPAWEENDPQRLISLMETPWGWESKGRPINRPLINLLQPDTVQKQKEIIFSQIISAQLSNGAFSWFPSGPESLYMTIYVVEGFAQAKRFGLETPTQVIRKALHYIEKKITTYMKEANPPVVCAYAGYVLGSFLREHPQLKTTLTEWTKFLEKHIDDLVPLSKAHLGYLYFYLGDFKRANEILDMIMDSVREDPIVGAYWTPERYSWVWYSDSVEKHAFFLKMLQELRPNDSHIPGMVKWLLFNRKGNVWKSTKASAAAVYALLDFLAQRGDFDQEEKFDIQWGDENWTLQVSPNDVIETPLRWQKENDEIQKKHDHVVIQKQGPGLAFAHLTWKYSTDQLSEASEEGLMNVERKYFRRVQEDDGFHLWPIQSQDTLQVGDQIEVQLTVKTKSAFEYVHLKDVKPAGFEAETLLSGWRCDKLCFYQEQRDSVTNFFMDRLPHGEYVMRYHLRPTKPGVYRVGSATLQSMYAPEITGYSDGFVIEVR